MSGKLRRARVAPTLTAGLLLLASSVAVGESHDSYRDGLGVDSQLAESRRVLADSRERKALALETLAGLSPKADAAREHLHKNARAMYRVSRGGMLPVAGGMGALLGHASRVSRLSQVVQRDLAALRQLDAESATLRRDIEELERVIERGERALSQLEVAQASALRERVSRRTLESALEGLSGAPPVRNRAQYGLSVVGGAPTERFTDQRGNLALPVSGPSSIQDATRAESDGPGLEFAATQGAAVRAAAGGRVAFAEPYGSYGKLVIIEHGERYYTGYGGLAQLDVQVGDDLSKSARIGGAGSEPIYFEVRRGTKSQDARAWLGL